MDAYDTPTDVLIQHEETFKKSRFITFITRREGALQAKRFLQSIRAAHPQARHHCWAWVAGAPDDSQQMACSDDGEPAGTAGKPMLTLLTTSQLGEIVTVVVRYYGGIQLGTGGLVRAYSGGVAAGLKQIARVRKWVTAQFTLRCAYRQLAEIERLIKHVNGSLRERQCLADVLLLFAIPVHQIAMFEKKLADLSQGQLKIVPARGDD